MFSKMTLAACAAGVVVARNPKNPVSLRRRLANHEHVLSLDQIGKLAGLTPKENQVLEQLGARRMKFGMDDTINSPAEHAKAISDWKITLGEKHLLGDLEPDLYTMTDKLEHLEFGNLDLFDNIRNPLRLIKNLGENTKHSTTELEKAFIDGDISDVYQVLAGNPELFEAVSRKVANVAEAKAAAAAEQKWIEDLVAMDYDDLTSVIVDELEKVNVDEEFINTVLENKPADWVDVDPNGMQNVYEALNKVLDTNAFDAKIEGIVGNQLPEPAQVNPVDIDIDIDIDLDMTNILEEQINGMDRAVEAVSDMNFDTLIPDFDFSGLTDALDIGTNAVETFVEALAENAVENLV